MPEDKKSAMFYESPYCYRDGTVSVRLPAEEAPEETIAAYFADSTLSGLDYQILEILYRLHCASRRTIEEELTLSRRPKDLKRTLRHLFDCGVVSGLSAAGGKEIRFYRLTGHSVSFMQGRGTETEIPYTGQEDLRALFAQMAYRQLEKALLPTLSGRLRTHIRNYAIHGIEGNLISDGYLELSDGQQAALLYIHVVRGGHGQLLNAVQWYRVFAGYTSHSPAASVLFLCEDQQQVAELSAELSRRFPDSQPARYFTYDTLAFQGQRTQRIVLCSGDTMHYGFFAFPRTGQQ